MQTYISNIKMYMIILNILIRKLEMFSIQGKMAISTVLDLKMVFIRQKYYSPEQLLIDMVKKQESILPLQAPHLRKGPCHHLWMVQIRHNIELLHQ